jgi:hypothetical protein
MARSAIVVAALALVSVPALLQSQALTSEAGAVAMATEVPLCNKVCWLQWNPQTGNQIGAACVDDPRSPPPAEVPHGTNCLVVNFDCELYHVCPPELAILSADGRLLRITASSCSSPGKSGRQRTVLG